MAALVRPYHTDHGVGIEYPIDNFMEDPGVFLASAHDRRR